MARNLDLNSLPPFEEVNTNLELGLPSMQAMTIQDNEDEEMIICSPRSFYQAVNRSNEHRQVTHMAYQEVGSHGGHSASCEANGNMRMIMSTTQASDGITPSISRAGQDTLEASQVAMLNVAPIYECPICMDEVVEETSTKCGHIFCRSCIITALDIEKKCPVCRLRVTVRDTFRIYLPNRS